MLEEGIEAIGDERDVAWTEWDGRDSFTRLFNSSEPTGNPCVGEDDELETDRCLAGDDMVRAGAVIGYTWGQPRSGEDIGDPDDAEPRFVPASMDTLVAANAS